MIKHLLSILLACCASLALADVAVTEKAGTNDLYKGSKKLGAYANAQACTDAAKALAASKVATYSCKNTRSLAVTLVTPPPPPTPHMHGGVQGIRHDNMIDAGSGFWPGIDVVMFGPPVPFGPPPPSTDWEQPGAVRTVCNPSHMGNHDAIVYPGLPGLAHDHTFFRPGTDAFLTDANVRAPGNRSTCRSGTNDLTARWVPTMYDTVSMQAIIPQSLIVYYKTTGCNYSIPCSGTSDYTAAPLNNVHWVPKNFHIIAGDPSATTPTGHVRYSCFDSSGEAAATESIPACPAGNSLWMKVSFPQCVALDAAGSPLLDSPDHKSHASYMEGWPQYNSPLPGKQYRCPLSHPYQIPDITFNVVFAIKPGMDTSKWNLSCGSVHCAHGDWFDGWDQTVMLPTNEECLRKRRDCGTFVNFEGAAAGEFGGN